MHKLRDSPGDTEEDLKKQLDDIAGSGKVYVLGLGNTDRADDGAGVLVALALKRLFPTYSYSEHDGVEGVVLDISEKKEDATILFVDAADMKLSPGSIKVVAREDIRETEITTHRVAVALIASILERTGKSSAIISIQPKTIEFQGQVSNSVKSAIDRLVDILSQTIESRQ